MNIVPRVCLSLVLFTSGASRATSYEAIDLSEATGLPNARPMAINSSGVVAVVSYSPSDQHFRSALYDSGTRSVIREFQDDDYVQFLNSNATSTGNTLGARPPWFYDDSGRHELPALEGSAYSFALGINDQGDIAGYSNVGVSYDTSARASLYFAGDGTILDLGTLGGRDSIAWRVNSAQQVTGWSSLSGDPGSAPKHAFLWQDGAMQDLGTLGGTNSYGTALNEAGQVVGYAQTIYGAEHAMLFDGGTLVDLGTLPGDSDSRAASVNNNGDIVGSSTDRQRSATRGAVWTGGEVLDLNDLAPRDDGLVYQDAVGINDAGSIIAVAAAPGRPNSTSFTGVLLIPRD